MTTSIRESSSNRFFVAVANAISIASKINSLSTPFSLDTASATSKISLFMYLPLLTPGTGIALQRASNFSVSAPPISDAHLTKIKLWQLETRNYISFVDRINGQQVFLIFYCYTHISTFNGENRAFKFAAPIARYAQAQADLFTDITRVMRWCIKWTIHSGGRNFQRVFTFYWIFNVHHATYLTTDFFTVFKGYTIFGINI